MNAIKTLTIFLLFLSWSAFAQPAGQAVLATGPVFVKNKLSQKPLLQDAIVHAGDQLITHKGGYIHLRMQDGSLLVVRPESTLDIEVFQFNPAEPALGRIRYKLLNGTSRSVTGAIGQANKEAFRFNTPVAAIGVRGTDFIASTTDEQTRVSVSQGAVVIASLSALCQANSFGPCTANSMLLEAGSKFGFVEVNSLNALPRLRFDMENSPSHKTPATVAEPIALMENNKTLARDLATEPVSAAPVIAPTKPVAALPLVEPVVHWGRWNSVLIGVAGPTIAELTALGQPVQLANELFGIGVTKMPERLPQSGQASFNLGPSDAYLVTPDGKFQAASLLNGTLAVNFQTSKFRINTDLRAQNQTYQLYAAGPVEFRGYLMSDPAQSNAKINTVLHADLNHAASLLTKPLSDGGTLLGAIAWQR